MLTGDIFREEQLDKFEKNKEYFIDQSKYKMIAIYMWDDDKYKLIENFAL